MILVDTNVLSELTRLTPDGQIAAIALMHGMSVATRNVGDFEPAGVAIVNPWE